MTIAMMHQWPPPIGLEEEQVCRINIPKELKRRACEAACSLKEAMTVAVETSPQFASIHDFLDYVIVTTDLSLKPECTLELDAAKALTNINDVIDQQALGEALQLPENSVQALKILQMHLRDLVILACSRNTEQSVFRTQGIPTVLRLRLEKVFGIDLKRNEKLWGNLGNSKFHIWNNGQRFKKRKHRHGRGSRMARFSLADAVCDSETEGDVSAESSGAAGSCSDMSTVAKAGPAYVTTTVNWSDLKFNFTPNGDGEAADAAPREPIKLQIVYNPDGSALWA